MSNAIGYYLLNKSEKNMPNIKKVRELNECERRLICSRFKRHCDKCPLHLGETLGCMDNYIEHFNKVESLMNKKIDVDAKLKLTNEEKINDLLSECFHLTRQEREIVRKKIIEIMGEEDESKSCN